MRIVLNWLSSVKTSYLPAFITLIALFCATLFKDMANFQTSTANIVFYFICLFNFLFLCFSKDTRSLFFSLFILYLYIVTGRITHSYLEINEMPSLSTWFTLLVPLNIFFIFKISPKHAHSFALLCFFLFEATIVENFYRLNLVDLSSMFSFVATFFWSALFCYFLLSVSITPSIKDSAFFFASFLIFWAFLNITDLPYFIFSLSGALFLIFISNITSDIYRHFRDPATGLYSLNSFKRHDEKIFPPKYIVAFFYIDNYAKILNVFKQKQTDKIVQMVLKRVLSFEPDALCYRLKPDQFCFVFFDTDIKQTYELMENMRRLVAGTEFVLSKKKIIKLTITPAVSEKKRSDADAFAVLTRMYENFRQRYSFTQNMTFCEELEKSKKTYRTPSRP